jgi:PAS domain S-box-containing protein/putative nucleotidyltransferase with HDIG domain
MKIKTIEELINELCFKKECEQFCPFGIFSRLSARLSELSSKDDIYQVISNGLHELVGNAIVLVNSLNEKSGVFCLRAIAGTEEHIDYLSRVLNDYGLIGMTLKINEVARKELKSCTLKEVPGGLTELAMGGIPESICTSIDKHLNISGVYAIGFTRKGRLFGSASFLMLNGKNEINHDLIQSFVSLSSIAIQRWQAEQALQRAHNELELRVKERTARLQKLNKNLKSEIIERKRTAKLAKASEEKYSLLVNNSYQAITVAQDNMLKFVNPRAMEILGYSEKEIMSQPFLSFIHPEDREMIARRHMDRLNGKPVPHVYPFRVVDKKGNTKWLEINAVIIEWDGRQATLNFLSDITERKQTEEDLKYSFSRLHSTMQGTIRVMSSIVELRDPYTAGHQLRVTKLACAIAEKMGLSAEQIDGIRAAGLVHDIGKIYVPAEILSKPGQLNEVEYIMIKTHPKVGHDILKQIDFIWPVAEIVLQHHERMDGSGYPSGLTGEQIMIESRILAAADVIEATASHRPYRAGLGIEKALEELIQGKGTLYDPGVVDTCLALCRQKSFQF